MDMDGDGEGDQGEGEAARSDTPRGQEGLEGPRLDDGKLFWGQRPDWLPENFFDGKTGEVKLEALAKSQADLRKQISSGDHKPPPKPEGYDFTPSEENAKIASAIIQGDDDPLVSGFRARAHELGLSQTQASALFNGFLQDAEAILPAPLDVQAEMKKLGPNARGVIQHMKSRADHLEKLGVFDQTTKQEFLLAAGTADGIRMLDAFAQSFGAPRLTDVLRQEMQSSPQAEEFRAKRQELGTRLDKKELTPVQYEREMKKLQDEQDALSGGG